jgi:hypothetical protein
VERRTRGGEKGIQRKNIWENIFARIYMLSFFYEKCRAYFPAKLLFLDPIDFFSFGGMILVENFGKKITSRKISCTKKFSQLLKKFAKRKKNVQLIFSPGSIFSNTRMTEANFLEKRMNWEEILQTEKCFCSQPKLSLIFSIIKFIFGEYVPTERKLPVGKISNLVKR